MWKLLLFVKHSGWFPREADSEKAKKAQIIQITNIIAQLLIFSFSDLRLCATVIHADTGKRLISVLKQPACR